MADTANSPQIMQAAQPNHNDAAASLLSLSLAASSAQPIPVKDRADSANATGGLSSTSYDGNLGTSLNLQPTIPISPPVSTSVGNGGRQHRRLASTGKARRRLSDARDAANRPSPAALQTAAAALSLASLSLSTSPPLGGAAHVSTSFTTASNHTTFNGAQPIPPSRVNTDDTPNSLPLNDGINIPPTSVVNNDDSKGNGAISIPITNGKPGKKRGMDHKCESCSKIYRHPSCLIKHRWEHTPHWREASKFVLSKHQQVQLLEAAAILSHLSPSSSNGNSLPDDRSLWPSFLSGGSLPLPDGTAPPGTKDTSTTSNQPIAVSGPVSASPYSPHPTSSSVPASAMLGNFNRANSAGPRLHDYSIPSSASGTASVTQVRPGLIGIPTGNPGIVIAPTPPMPVPVPNTNGHTDPHAFVGYRSASSGTWGSSYGNGQTPSSYHSNALSSGSPYAHSDERSVTNGTGGWSLPRSSLRSVSVSSRSRSGSASGSRSDDDIFEVDVDVDGDMDDHSSSGYGRKYGFSSTERSGRPWKREDDELSITFSVREEDEEDEVMVISGAPMKKAPEWDGMEMEMDMD